MEGFPFQCFLDAYKGYYQVHIRREYEEKTPFHTDRGTLCYWKIPFGLKNIGATYQPLMDKVFVNQIGRKVEVYVDDMFIKIHHKALLHKIEETFQTLMRTWIKLNPGKFTFGWRKASSWVINNQ